MGERRVRNAKVGSSILLRSTNFSLYITLLPGIVHSCDVVFDWERDQNVTERHPMPQPLLEPSQAQGVHTAQ